MYSTPTGTASIDTEQMIQDFFHLLFSHESLRIYWYSTSSKQIPAFYAKENENDVFVILTISSFYLKGWRNVMRISGIKEIRNFRILLPYPQCPSNTKSCLFPNTQKASKSIQRSANQNSFLSCFWGSLIPFLTLRIVLLCKIVS